MRRHRRCERIYGHHYSKQQVSFLANTSKGEIQKWLDRKLAPYYWAVYIDSTYAYTRCVDRVAKEAYYTMFGLLPGGVREVLSVVNHPTEGALNWEAELKALKARA